MEKDVFASVFQEYDKQTKAIKDMQDPEEVKAALEILGEKIDETPDGDILSKTTESEELDEDQEKDISKVIEEKEKKPDDIRVEVEKKISDGEITPPDGEDKFLLTNEVIEKQPEEDRKILNNFKDKGKDEIAQAAAHAVAMKSSYLKDNEKMIAQIKEQFLERSDEELIKILVDTQRETGKTVLPDDQKKAIEVKIELPELPDDDPNIQKILDEETLKRLRVAYPSIPVVESMDSEEFNEWVRDLNVDKPLNSLKQDLEKMKGAVKSELSKVVYIQENLPNLYEESANEVLPLLTAENLPRLKALNDSPMDVLVQDIQTEVEMIRENLKKKGLTEKDIDVDLTITKDDKGIPFNKFLNDLIMEGKTADGQPIPSGKIIGQRGKTFWLKSGKLAEKFKNEYEDKILTAFVNKKNQTARIVKEKLKDETLIEGSGKGRSGNRKVYTVEDIQKEQDPMKIKKILAELE